MKQYDSTAVRIPTQEEPRGILEEVLRNGAQKLLASALENEVEELIERLKNERNDAGHQQVVRNGYHQKRTLVTGIGPLSVQPPRVRDKAGTIRFSSSILPTYMRRLPSIDNLIPVLYLKGISTSDFPEALRAILGDQAAGLSATNIVRLKQVWEQEYGEWAKRDLTDKHYAYIWVDGIYFNVRLDAERQCILVIMGATADGKKELIAVRDGYRESAQSWRELLLQLKKQGWKMPPNLAIGDGALGFWLALSEIFPSTRHQRCWVHKTANILDKMPKSV
jgi:putative transposase